jgi:hypothetical protein
MVVTLTMFVEELIMDFDGPEIWLVSTIESCGAMDDERLGCVAMDTITTTAP